MLKKEEITNWSQKEAPIEINFDNFDYLEEGADDPDFNNGYFEVI